MRFALGEFGRDPHVAGILEVARDAGVGRRCLAILFREQVGLTPKQHCRLRRFQLVVRRVASGTPIDCAQVLLDGGYFDQAQMAHEFCEFPASPPARGWRANGRLRTARSWIDPLFPFLQDGGPYAVRFCLHA